MGCFGYICKGCGTPIRGDCWNGGEKCVLIHVRHGKELGRVEGHYDEYGRVIEENEVDDNIRFMGSGQGVNSHREICDSIFGLKDSYNKIIEKRMYKGKNGNVQVDFSSFCHLRFLEDLEENDLNIKSLPYFTFMEKQNDLILLKYYLEEYTKYLEIKEKSVNDKDILLQKMKCLSYADVLIDTLVWLFYKQTNKWFKKEFDNLPSVHLEEYSGIVAYHSVCYQKAMREGTFNLIPSLDDPDQSWGPIRKKYK